MKKHFLKIASIIVFLGLLSCEKTEIFLNDAGNPADFSGTWQTSDYIQKTSYLANVKDANGNQTYRDTVVVDSTRLTFVFGEGRTDSVRVTSVKRVNGVNQAPVNLPAGKWSFALGVSKGEEKSGLTYFNVFSVTYPNNAVTGFALVYTYSKLSATSMEIKWLSSSGSPQNTINYKAVLNKL